MVMTKWPCLCSRSMTFFGVSSTPLRRGRATPSHRGRATPLRRGGPHPSAGVGQAAIPKVNQITSYSNQRQTYPSVETLYPTPPCCTSVFIIIKGQLLKNH